MSLPADIDGREARRRDHRDLIVDHLAQRAEQRRLAGTRTPRNEEVTVTAPHVIERRLVFGRRRHALRPNEIGNRSFRLRNGRRHTEPLCCIARA
jgi:hypothetical protein